MRTIGLTLLLIGITILAFSAFSMIVKEKDFKVGRVEMNDPTKREVSWIPVVGGIIFIAGAVVSVVYRNQQKV